LAVAIIFSAIPPNADTKTIHGLKIWDSFFGKLPMCKHAD
jgi:hypothetical protein